MKTILLLLVLLSCTMAQNVKYNERSGVNWWQFFGIVSVDGVVLKSGTLKVYTNITTRNAYVRPFGDIAVEYRKDINYISQFEVRDSAEYIIYATYDYHNQSPLLYWKPTTPLYFKLGRNNWINFDFKAPVPIIGENRKPVKLDINTIQSNIKIYNTKGQLIQEVRDISFASCYTLDLPHGTYIGMANTMVHKFKK